MRFKLDENLGTGALELFRAAGHDVKTILSEGLQGSSDQQLYEVCCSEERCLVTLDLDFSDVLRFPPTDAHGIVVIRVPRNPSLPLLEQPVGQFLESVSRLPVEKGLWIVKMGRVRIHQRNGGN
jgi:predicted nuclease of predicted toxin-antitoxin system